MTAMTDVKLTLYINRNKYVCRKVYRSLEADVGPSNFQVKSLAELIQRTQVLHLLAAAPVTIFRLTYVGPSCFCMDRRHLNSMITELQTHFSHKD